MDKIEWIRDVIFLLPIAGLIWSAATMASKVKKHDEDIKELKQQNTENFNLLMDKLNTIIESINNIKIDVAILKTDGKGSKKDE